MIAIRFCARILDDRVTCQSPLLLESIGMPRGSLLEGLRGYTPNVELDTTEDREVTQTGQCSLQLHSFRGTASNSKIVFSK